MNNKLFSPLVAAAITLFFSIFFTDVSSQSFTVNVLSDMCLDDGEAEVVLDAIPEPVTVSWHNTTLDEYHTGMNPSDLKDGSYLVTVTDANNVEYTQYAWINPTIWWYPNEWPGPSAPCPDGTATAEIFIQGGSPSYDIYVDEVLDGNTTSDSYTTSPLGIGNHPVYIIDDLGCRSSYAPFETDSNSINVIAETDLEIEMSWVDEACGGPFTVSYEILTESAPPYNIHWEYWDGNDYVQEYADELDGLSNGTSVTLVTEDANGCEVMFYDYVWEQNVLQANGSSSAAVCPNDNGAIYMNVYGGTPPYDFLWSNGETTEDITGLAYGNYTLSVTDSEGCFNTFTKHVGQTSNVNVGGTSTPPNCEENIPGSISSIVLGGVPPYSYSWNTDETTENISVDNFGYYTVTVTDAEGCVGGDSYYIPISDPCYSYVSGTVYYDLDGNCDINGDDFPLTANVYSTNSNYAYTTYPYTNNYERRFLDDIELTASSPGYSLICPNSDVSLTYVPNTSYPNVDFFLQPDELNDDLCVLGWGSNPVPGFDGSQAMYVTNPGTTVLDATLQMEYTTLIDFTNSSHTPSSVDEDNGIVTWDLTNIEPNSTQYIYFYFQTDASVELGEEVLFSVSLLNVDSDVNPDNNQTTYFKTVVGSYDPNDKQVFPSGEGENHIIDPETPELIYTVRFQNTGTAPAVNVVIQDELDPATMNIQTAQVIDTSHSLTDFTLDGDKAYFAFEGIYLPDSTANLEASQGFVTFKVQLNEGLPLGTVVENDAAIYFDFNEPIITNNAFVTLDLADNVSELSLDQSPVIFPNPTSDLINIKTELGLEELQILDSSGRLVLSESNISFKNTYQVQLPESMSNGVYFVRTKSGNSTSHQELVVIR